MLLMLLLRYSNAENIWNKNPLLNWDAGHYNEVAHVSYEGINTAFFPLFPFMWKVSSVRVYGIVIINALIFLAASSWLAATFSINLRYYLLLLAFPTLLFMFLPYSEALFFFATAGVLCGMAKGKDGLVFAGMLIASMTRPVVYIFIPAIILMLFLAEVKTSAIKKIFVYIIPVLLGLAVVMLIQYIDTGNMLSFFSSQKQWGNGLRLPAFHLTSWGGDNIVRLDGTAFLVGIVATIALFRIFFKRIKGMEVKASQVLIFSMLYLAGISWFVLFTRGGSLFSLNRFVYATPFFFVAFYAFVKQTWTPKQYLLIFIGLNAFWLLLGSYVHIQQVLKFLLLSIFVMSFMFVSHSKKYLAVPAYLICIIGNVALQVYCYYYFLNGGWIG